MSNKKNKDVEQVNEGRYTEEQLMVRLKVFIGAILGLTLFGIVFVVLFSLIFVTQPLNAISPIDTKFFELIIPIATFLTGTLSGIMLAGNNKEAQAEALKAANSGWIVYQQHQHRADHRAIADLALVDLLYRQACRVCQAHLDQHQQHRQQVWH
jgi:hypothetical protein